MTSVAGNQPAETQPSARVRVPPVARRSSLARPARWRAACSRPVGGADAAARAAAQPRRVADRRRALSRPAGAAAAGARQPGTRRHLPGGARYGRRPQAAAAARDAEALDRLDSCTRSATTCAATSRARRSGATPRPSSWRASCPTIRRSRTRLSGWPNRRRRSSSACISARSRSRRCGPRHAGVPITAPMETVARSGHPVVLRAIARRHRAERRPARRSRGQGPCRAGSRRDRGARRRSAR